MKKITFFTLFTIIISSCFAQTSFDCNGRMFRVVEADKTTILQEIYVTANDDVSLVDLNTYEGYSLNGIAYNRHDDYIYGVVIQPNYQLIRIDSDYQLEILKPLPLPSHISFVSGDITPNGRFLVMLGFGADKKYNTLALVDLQSPTYETKLFKTQTTSGASVLCADVAFHPTTEVLYGFDHATARLITIDLESKTIDNTSFPRLHNLQGNVPSLFFDSKGNLYGVGSIGNIQTDRYFFKINSSTGEATILNHLGLETFQDACSCPVQVALLNRVSQRIGYPCTELSFEITLTNRTNRVLNGLLLENSLPEGFSIVSVSDLPFEGVLSYDLRNLSIRDLVLPIGNYQFTMQVAAAENSSIQNYENQAVLSGDALKQLFGKATMVSDDPETLVFNDPTSFGLEQLRVNFGQDEFFICAGRTITLQPKVEGTGLHYRWSTGSDAPAIEIDEPGNYEVEVITGCEAAKGSVEVRYEEVGLSLGEDIEAEFGELLSIQPTVTAATPVNHYQWNANSSLPNYCINCPNLKVTLEENTTFTLEIETETGCKTKDEIHISLKGFSVYSPNAFSPNGDGVNDFFYLQSNRDYQVKLFRVFDRWGNSLLERTDVHTNNTDDGWNGSHNNSPVLPGVYLWKADILNKAGKIISKQGEVSLFLDTNTY